MRALCFLQRRNVIVSALGVHCNMKCAVIAQDLIILCDKRNVMAIRAQFVKY